MMLNVCLVNLVGVLVTRIYVDLAFLRKCISFLLRFATVTLNSVEAQFYFYYKDSEHGGSVVQCQTPVLCP